MSAADLLVVGAGHLGARVAQLWLAANDAEVLAETVTTWRHADLRRDGAIPRRREDPEPVPRPNVLFCVPPSAVEDYAAEARRAVRLWSGQGRLLMTSSTAVYAETEGGECRERSPVASGERAGRLLQAEEPVLSAGGSVLRLAGLYDLERGPHRVFLRQRTSPRRGDGLVNLIHYDDAATLCVRALERGKAGEIYLGSDGSPLTRQRLADSARASDLFGAAQGTAPRCVFEGSQGPLGRRCNSEVTRRLLGWEPRHASFVAWLRSCGAQLGGG